MLISGATPVKIVVLILAVAIFFYLITKLFIFNQTIDVYISTLR